MEETRILIVDDNLEIREIIHVLLGGEGFEIEEAGDGTEALDAIRKNSFDLIILDIMMPGLNGYQTCLEIRKRRKVTRPWDFPAAGTTIWKNRFPIMSSSAAARH